MPLTQLQHLFDEDAEHAERLYELIESEHQALVARDLPQLELLIDQKQPILALLAQHAQARAELLSQLGYDANRAGLVALSNTRNLDGALLTSADTLTQALEACQAANERNGSLLRSNQSATAKVLGLLRGTEAPNLYDHKGSSSRAQPGRPLSQA